jgi:hypothetical protein
MHILGVEHRREPSIADQIAKQHSNWTAISFEIGCSPWIRRRGLVRDDRATAPAAILLAYLVRKAAIIARYL